MLVVDRTLMDTAVLVLIGLKWCYFNTWRAERRIEIVRKRERERERGSICLGVCRWMVLSAEQSAIWHSRVIIGIQCRRLWQPAMKTLKTTDTACWFHLFVRLGRGLATGLSTVGRLPRNLPSPDLYTLNPQCLVYFENVLFLTPFTLLCWHL